MNIYLISILLGVIEGLTEFLPVSSTAHLRIAQALLDLDLTSSYWKAYSIVIQLGAILSVVVYFRARLWAFLTNFRFRAQAPLEDAPAPTPPKTEGDAADLAWLRQSFSGPKREPDPSWSVEPSRHGFFRQPLTLVAIAFVTTALPAFVLRKVVHANLESLFVIATSLVVGGIVMVLVDLLCTRPRTTRIEDMTLLQSLWIGVVQILSAVFPGTSRSMATIAAGQTAGLSRHTALEFSFFVGIPLMFAATGYELFKLIREEGLNLTGDQWGALAVGFAVSFVTAWGVIAWFLHWVRRHGFLLFGLYRIALGAAIWWWTRS